MPSGRFDAVVVGAGPAGSVAALVLARSGARVALADKAAFPRDKACGDLVGPRGVQVLADLGLRVPDAGQGSDLLAVGPSGGRCRLPAFTGRTYPGHGIIVPRLALDHALREAAVQAGAVPVRARITAVEADADGRVDAVISSDGQRLAGEIIIGADGALSPVARLAGMLDPRTALWGFAIRGYVPAEVPLPLLVLLDASPWRIYPGYGWLFPGADGQANVGIGIGLGSSRRQAPLRGDLARLVALLGQRGDLSGNARPGPVMGGWLRMGATGTRPAAGNVLLAGDAAGLINPLQGEGIGPAMVSARLAAEAVLAGPARAGPAYAEAVEATFGPYMPGASALQSTLLRRPRTTSAVTRLLTAPMMRRAIAGTWSIYWNGLVDGARPRPSAWTARAVQFLVGHLAGHGFGEDRESPSRRLPLTRVRVRAFVWHTATMRSLHWPGVRQAPAALAVMGCLALAACGGGGSSSAKPASPTPTTSATAAAEPVSGPAAVAAIKANWQTVFNGKASIPSRLALVQDGRQVAAFVNAQAKTSFGAAATGSTATISSVTITSPSQATVHYEVLLLGTPLLKNQVGTAIYLNGIWKVAIASFCGLAYLEYSKTSPQLPAVCRS